MHMCQPQARSFGPRERKGWLDSAVVDPASSYACTGRTYREKHFENQGVGNHRLRYTQTKIKPQGAGLPLQQQYIAMKADRVIIEGSMSRLH